MINSQKFVDLPIDTKFKTSVGTFVKTSNEFPTFDEFMYGNPKMNATLILDQYDNVLDHSVSMNRKDLVEVINES